MNMGFDRVFKWYCNSCEVVAETHSGLPDNWEWKQTKEGVHHSCGFCSGKQKSKSTDLQSRTSIQLERIQNSLKTANAEIKHLKTCLKVQTLNLESVELFKQLEQLQIENEELRRKIAAQERDVLLNRHFGEGRRKKYGRPLVVPGKKSGYCGMCEGYHPLTKHHITPRSHGGRAKVDICAICHEFIHFNFNNNELANMTWEDVKQHEKVQVFLKAVVK